jgi:hypothetical protein
MGAVIVMFVRRGKPLGRSDQHRFVPEPKGTDTSSYRGRPIQATGTVSYAICPNTYALRRNTSSVGITTENNLWISRAIHFLFS